ncbi:alpha/beta hydrolase [Clostridium weizhouense]|uniref:Alpha/beta hydrolase n=1 Tax=Clostridium weizhouense TaxID=2859781 RepID=A0ABS7AKK7_9CLOT|nr:alpha/beta hydrolase [Clostridium weizhouense]MBW6409190.1 alpha/beta hydrolase [Clostridium weizhouense]
MKKFLKIFLLIILLFISVTSFIFRKKIMLTYNIVNNLISLNDNINSYNTFNLKPDESMSYKNVVYKNTNNAELTLDIYNPLKNIYKKSPVIVYVHGGSWVYGDKTIPEALSPVLNIFRENGFTIISTSYELMKNKENFQKQICDVKDTIRWIYKNSDSYNLDTDEIGLIGLSSGAHLSLMSAYTSNDQFQDDSELAKFSSKVKYIIDFFGPTDLSLLNTSNLNWDLNNIFNSARLKKEDIINEFNPINYVTSNIPKTLIIHSKSDSLVPYESSLKLYNKCIEANAHAKLFPIENAEHSLSEISSDDIINLSKEILKFIVTNSPL